MHNTPSHMEISVKINRITNSFCQVPSFCILDAFGLQSKKLASNGCSFPIKGILTVFQLISVGICTPVQFKTLFALSIHSKLLLLHCLSFLLIIQPLCLK
ncbi:hypothetical protein HOLleu_44380 [Holothuria leucospilota]|uniref:Uncharacterized protein n=1 Tax=Holothuria leucospilota TaxID=206669 RepID=A0A9Q0Y9P2_HOLLE|nr:hypothetical protein HOLleu_44380 [Holothuria leucospilota]